MFQTFVDIKKSRRVKSDIYGPLSNALEAIRGEKRNAYGGLSDEEGERILKASHNVSSSNSFIEI